MKFCSAVTRIPNIPEAVQDLAARLSLPEGTDIAAVFFSSAFTPNAEELAALLREKTGCKTLIGCSAEAVIGGGEEIEDEPAISLVAASMPEARLQPFHIGKDEWQGLLSDDDAFASAIGASPDVKARILVAEPFTTPIGEFLGSLNRVAPGVPVVGGVASGGMQAGRNVLVLNDSVVSDGVAGISFSGDIRVDTLVSQGCNPVGETMLVTEAEANVIFKLGGRPALQVLEDMVTKLTEDEKTQLQNGIFLGVVIDEYKHEFQPGDFLVRNLVGVDASNGAVAVADFVRPGQTVQMHIRSAKAATADLAGLLQSHAEFLLPPAGGFLFSCNGRGLRLFEEPSHDIGLSERYFPDTPVGGFFAGGEFGPVGGQTFIHGFTASFAFFRPDSAQVPNT